MSGPGNSTLKVPYDIRPCKQIERRMMLDLFQGLTGIGFPIPEYQYTGMGSIFYVDFMLFRKFLGINDMLSVEMNKTLTTRVVFNKPYKNINHYMGKIDEVIPSLSRSKRHLLWLDYDCIFEEFMINDLIESFNNLMSGSIVIITVDVDYKSVQEQTNRAWKDHFEEQSGHYLTKSLPTSKFSEEELPNRVADIINNISSKVSATRDDVTFCPLFNIVYADKHRMMTFGGMLCDTKDKKKLKKLKWSSYPFALNNFEYKPYYEVFMPNLTRKERLYLDSNMPADADWIPNDFILPVDQLEIYKKMFKYCPHYSEVMI